MKIVRLWFVALLAMALFHGERQINFHVPHVAPLPAWPPPELDIAELKRQFFDPENNPVDEERQKLLDVLFPKMPEPREWSSLLDQTTGTIVDPAAAAAHWNWQIQQLGWAHQSRCQATPGAGTISPIAGPCTGLVAESSDGPAYSSAPGEGGITSAQHQVFNPLSGQGWSLDRPCLPFSTEGVR